MKKPVRAKKHRLPEQAYWGDVRVFITARIERGFPFKSQEVVQPQLDILRHVCDQFHSSVPIYCFMPDHLHLIIGGQEPRSRPKMAMDLFKQLSGYWFAEHMPPYDWQESYYDEKIRKFEQWQTTAMYVLNNPLRAGLVSDPYDYPFTGSIGWDLKKLMSGMVPT